MLSEKQILEKKQYGDINVIAQMLSNKTGKYITPNYVAQILNRPGSGYYADAINALRELVATRERLINEATCH